MKPSKRFKKRYISFILLSNSKPVSYQEAKEIVHEHFLSFFGELGISSLAFKLIKYNHSDGKGMLRCERGMVDDAIFCMACLSEYKGKSCRLSPLSTGGSIKRT